MMKLQAKTNYAFIGLSGYLKNAVSSMLLYLNAEEGIPNYENIFGKMVVISDTQVPIKNKVWVISFVKRDEPFTVIDAEESFLDIVNQMDGTNYSRSDIRKAGKYSDLNDLYYKLTFGRTNNFTFTQLCNVFAPMVANLTSANVEEYYNVAKNFDYQSTINLISMAINGSLSQYLSRYNQELPKSAYWYKNLMKLSSAVIHSKSFDTFMSYLLIQTYKSDKQ